MLTVLESPGDLKQLGTSSESMRPAYSNAPLKYEFEVYPFFEGSGMSAYLSELSSALHILILEVYPFIRTEI
jgi:hypothetical protein